MSIHPTVAEPGVSILSPTDTYLPELLNRRQPLSPKLNGETATWLRAWRDRAAEEVLQLGIPTTRDEEWRFTDLSSLQQVTFDAAGDRVDARQAVESFSLPEAAQRLVFVNGVYAPHLSSLADLPSGVTVGTLAELPLAYQDQARRYLAQQPAGDVFTALNAASLLDIAVVWAAKNCAVAQPIHLLLVTTPSEKPIIVHPRCLVVAETGSALTLVEDHVAAGPGIYFTNPVTAVWVQNNAQVNHSRIQRDAQVAFHIGTTAVSQARDSRYTCSAISLGAKLSRHNLTVTQTGVQTETVLNGLTIATGSQLADTHSAIAYTQPYGTSDQLHKCIVNDQARAVFNGKIFVPKAAQLTDAAQLNQNLLLSPKARVDTKPQLEIVADNVKCTHGATVGQLDAEEVFYLQSRGLDRASACSLLIQAFADEVIERVPIPSLQKTLSQAVSIDAQSS